MKEKIRAFMLKAKEKVNQLMRSMTALAAAGAFFVGTAYADGDNLLMGSALFKGVKNMLTDAGVAMTILCPIVGGMAYGFFMWRRSLADENDGKLWEKRAKTALFCGVGGCFGSAIIALAASYF